MAVSSISIAQITSANLFADTDQENSAVSVKGSSTTIYEIEIDNTLNAAQDNYVKFYNTAGVGNATTPQLNQRQLPLPTKGKLLMK